MNRALKAIEVVRNAIDEDFERFVIFVTAYFAGLEAGVELVFRFTRQVRFQDSRCIFSFVTFNHDPRLPAAKRPGYWGKSQSERGTKD